jgi:hypothetical protein
MLMAGLAAAGVLVSVIKAIYEMVWGTNARLEKISAAITERTAREKAEGAALKAERKRIQAEAAKTAQDLADELNKTWNEPRP